MANDNIKNRKVRKRHSRLTPSAFNGVVIACILIALIFTELILSNDTLISETFGGYESKSIKLVDNDNIRQESDGLYIDNINIPACCLGLKIEGKDSYGYIQVSMEDEYFGYDYQSAGRFFIYNSDDVTDHYIKVNPAGKLKSLKLSVFSDSTDFSLVGLTVNAKPSVKFNFLRWILFSVIISGIFLIIRKKLYSKTYESSNFAHRALIVVVVFLCVLNPLLINGFTSSKTQTKSYSHPLSKGDLSECSMYARQFDAFLSGRLDIDTPVNKEAVDAL